MSKIRIYTDESVNVSISEGLKRRGVEAFSVRDAGNLGLTDEEQLVFADKRDQAFLLMILISSGLLLCGLMREGPITG